MPNIAALLKTEITRLSKKVVKEQTGDLKDTLTAQKKQISALKQQVTALEKQVARLAKGAPSSKATTAANGTDDGSDIRFQARGLRSLRKRLGLSAHDFAKLAGVSAQSIYNWETEKASPRAAQIEAIAELRGIGKKEAYSRLEKLN